MFGIKRGAVRDCCKPAARNLFQWLACRRIGRYLSPSPTGPSESPLDDAGPCWQRQRQKIGLAETEESNVMVYRPRTKLKLARKAKRCPKCNKLVGMRVRCKTCHKKLR